MTRQAVHRAGAPRGAPPSSAWLAAYWKKSEAGGMRLAGGFPIVELGLGLTLVAGFGTMGAQEPERVGRGRPGIPTPVKIIIPAFPDGGVIPTKYANTPAGSVSPAIEWSGAPQATVTFALILH